MSPIQGKTASFSRDEQRAQSPSGHPPVVVVGKLKANDGSYAVGLLLTRAADLAFFALAVVAAEVIGVGDNATQVFSDTLLNFPVEPGTVSVTDGVETFTDDGSGRLVGSAGGAGTINYKTGKISVDFNANVANATNVTADYTTAIDGVIDETVDTAAEVAGNVVIHGGVQSSVLKVGKVAKAAPSATMLVRLQARGIFPG